MFNLIVKDPHSDHLSGLFWIESVTMLRVLELVAPFLRELFKTIEDRHVRQGFSELFCSAFSPRLQTSQQEEHS